MNRIALATAASTLAAIATLATAPATTSASGGCNPAHVQQLTEGLNYADGFLAALRNNPAATADAIGYAERNVTVTDAALTDVRATCDGE